LHLLLRTRLCLVLGGLLILILAACAGGNGDGGTPAGDGGGGDPSAITVAAADLVFDTDQIDAPAGEAFAIEFVNDDSVPHNIAIYTDESKSETLFEGEIINGGERITYQVPALDAGDYYFDCQVHPDMNGSVTAG
jgi:plastocyanin